MISDNNEKNKNKNEITTMFGRHAGRRVYRSPRSSCIPRSRNLEVLQKLLKTEKKLSYDESRRPLLLCMHWTRVHKTVKKKKKKSVGELLNNEKKKMIGKPVRPACAQLYESIL